MVKKSDNCPESEMEFRNAVVNDDCNDWFLSSEQILNLSVHANPKPKLI